MVKTLVNLGNLSKLFRQQEVIVQDDVITLGYNMFALYAFCHCLFSLKIIDTSDFNPHFYS